MHRLRATAVAFLALTITACGSSTGSPVASAPAAVSTPIHVLDFKLNPATVSASGGTVSLAVTNDGPTIHNVTIRDAAGKVIAATKDLWAGQSETLSTRIAPGGYVLFCSLPGHESLGVKGTLTVTP